MESNGLDLVRLIVLLLLEPVSLSSFDASEHVGRLSSIELLVDDALLSLLSFQFSHSVMICPLFFNQSMSLFLS